MGVQRRKEGIFWQPRGRRRANGAKGNPPRSHGAAPLPGGLCRRLMGQLGKAPGVFFVKTPGAFAGFRRMEKRPGWP